jgi:hypothetical protein
MLAAQPIGSRTPSDSSCAESAGRFRRLATSRARQSH